MESLKQTQKFEDESDSALMKVMFINPLQEATLRKDETSKDLIKISYSCSYERYNRRDFAVVRLLSQRKLNLLNTDKNNASGTITVVADTVTETETKKHVSTLVPGICLITLLMIKVEAVATQYACPIVVVDVRDPNEASTSRSFFRGRECFEFIYLKR